MDRELEKLCHLTYGHLITSFWLRLLEQKVTYQGSCVIMSELKDLDLVLAFVLEVSNKDIVFAWTIIRRRSKREL